MPEKLKNYNQKRNFNKTAEPEGRTEKPGVRLKFAVQHHIARREHYDLRLEWDGVLLSWAVPKGPSYNTKDKRLAVHVEDHPIEYRNFEGAIPKGEYGGGVVMLWDEGYWEPQFDVEEGLAGGSLKFELKGRRLKGKWALIRLKPGEGEDPDKNWLLLKEKDEYAQISDGISDFTTSIRTGRAMNEIETGAESKISVLRNPFTNTGIQLAKLVNKVPEEKDWLYELKYDGYRIIAYVENNAARLITRNGHDFTARFKSVADSLTDWAEGRAMVLDGEMVITNSQGKTDFQALQNYMKNPGGKRLTYIAFDLLALDGADLRGEQLIKRKAQLEALLKEAPDTIHYSRHVTGDGKNSFIAACQAGMEGIVGKKPDSVYSGTRNGDWIKLKCDTRQEFVIGGFTLTEKKLTGISALLLGVYEGRELIYAGRAGTGFTEKIMRELEKEFEDIKRENSSFRLAPKPKANEKLVWLDPVLVAEVKFAEWTEENQLRQASFKGLRRDKDPRDIKREAADKEISEDEKQKAELPAEETEKFMSASGNSIIIEGVTITNPGKIIFEAPKTTKADVVRYYAAVAQRMLPYVSNRILSIVRCPKGIAAACFYKKHPGPNSKGIVQIPLSENGGETEYYFYIEDAAGLIFEAQMGTLEFHTWGSRANEIEAPDTMVFDLDPDEGMDIERVRQGVLDLKSVLDQLSLVSFLKTDGGKGYHVVVPLKPYCDWEKFHDFARRVAEVMEQKWPDRYTSNVRKEKRKNKIFVDWIRNGRGATSIAPYSLRARAGAKVSMPITWEELYKVAPDSVDMAEALKRIKSADPWIDFYKTNQRLK